MPMVIETNMSRMPIQAREPMRFCCGERLSAFLANAMSFSGGTFGKNTICMTSTNTKKTLTKNGTCQPMTASVPERVEKTMAMMEPTAFAPPMTQWTRAPAPRRSTI